MNADSQEQAAPATPQAETAQLPRIVAIANQKGGVGKTTTAVNLGTALAANYKKVLVVDLDPQGNASTGLGIDPTKRENDVYRVLLGGARLADCAVETAVPGLFVVPSSVELSGAEIELVDADRRETRLADALGSGLKGYDYILIDCPPALGLLTVNALVAADQVLVPLQAEFYALEGLSHLLKTIDRIRARLNPELKLQGIVLTMYDRRNNLCELVAQDVRSVMGEAVYDTVIPRNVRVSEAPSHGLPVILYDIKCAGAEAYAKLAGEMLRREARGFSASLAT